MGVGIYGLIDDVFAVLPLDDLKVLLDMKMETRVYIKTLVTVTRSYVKTLVTVIHSPVLVVSIHFVYFYFDSCCFCYAHTSV
jgi:hypothetical protein